MIVQPYDWQPGTGLSPMSGDTEFDGGSAMDGLTAPAGYGGGSNDAISRMVPPWQSGEDWDESDASSGLGSSSLMSSLQGIMQQLGGIMQQMMGGSGSQQYQQQPEQYFQNASGGSVGDPHLSFDGSTWNNMSSQPNLLDSNSFPGGFQISTQTTAPNQNGVTWNQSATITTNYGQNSVSLNGSGVASIVSNGQQVPISPGQTIELGNGDSVTQNQNGSLQMTAQNNRGGSITTTLSPNGNGVDVQTTANNVDLGGTLVNGQNNTGTSQQYPWQPPESQPNPFPTNRPPNVRYATGAMTQND